MRPLPLIVSSLLAATVSIVCLIVAFSDGRIVSPFGWNRVVTVQVISSHAMAFVVAGFLCRTRLSLDFKPVAVIIAIAGIGLSAALTIFGGVFIAHGLEIGDAGFTVRTMVRTIWVLLLEIPCFWLVLLLVRPIRMPRHAFWHLIAWSMTTMVLVPYGFILTMTNKQTELARANWQAFRIDRAIEKVDRLCAVGSMASFGVNDSDSPGSQTVSSVDEGDGKRGMRDEHEKVTASQAQASLMQNATMLVEAIRLLQKQEGTIQNRLALARYFRALGELGDAVEILEPIAGQTPEAAVLLGRVLQARKEWESSSRWLQVAIDQILGQDHGGKRGMMLSEPSILLLYQSYDFLAQNARQMQQYSAAEQYYKEAIEQVPPHAAYFHYQLARHYDLGGRIQSSLLHHRLAHDLAPDRYAPPPSWFQKFFSSSTPVGLLAPSQSNY